MKKLLIPYDGNILELVEKKEKDERGRRLPEVIYVYSYVESATKKGMVLTLNQEQLDKLLNSGIAKKIE